MVLVFIFLGIIILFLLLFVILLLSSIRIEIKNLELGNKERITSKEKMTYNRKNAFNEVVSSKEQTTSTIKDAYQVKIGIYFLEKIPLLWFSLNNQKMKKLYTSKQLEKIDFKKLEKDVPLKKQTWAILKALQIRIKKLQLYVSIGTEDAILTSYIIAFLGSIIGILLPHITEKEQIQNCHYVVTPIYQDKNEYHLHLDSIICIKIVHIIYSSMLLIKKGREKYERTSNRRPYAYRYE